MQSFNAKAPAVLRKPARLAGRRQTGQLPEQPHAGVWSMANIVLTGPPGCGKTTVVRRVVELLRGCRLAGFYTQEIRREGTRVGFQAVSMDRTSRMLAHVNIRGPCRVGKYGVDVDGLEAIVNVEMAKLSTGIDLFVIDEIGKMECFSKTFIQAVQEILDSPVCVLATVAARGGGFIAAVKARHDINLVSVSKANRNDLPTELVSRFRD
jgi:nucleoside-triphosphatase